MVNREGRMQMRTLLWFIAAVALLLMVALAVSVHTGGGMPDWLARLHGR